MKEYKLVYLNKDFKLSTEKDFKQAEEVINKYAAEGWTLQQVEASHGIVGVLVGIFYREKIS